MFKKKIIFPLVIGLAVISLSAFTVVQSAGIQWWSGSPWDGGSGPAGTCANCHGGGATVPTFVVSSNPAFGSGNTTYAAGQTYTITATVSGTYPKYGFNMEILNSTSTSTATDKGTFGTGVSSNCTVFPSAGNPTTASHNISSGSGGTASFSFKWTAPASGTAFLYGCGLGVNNDGSSGVSNGDKVSAVTSFTLNAAPVGIEIHENANVNLKVYPNPATDNIRISYNLPERSKVSLKLYSITGELVSELVNETQDRGTQSIETRLPLTLAKGAYMVKLGINGKENLQKLLIY